MTFNKHLCTYAFNSLFFSFLQGLTVRMEGYKVTVARILIDSIIDRQGLLKTGDVILQANGKNIKDPEQLQTGYCCRS